MSFILGFINNVLLITPAILLLLLLTPLLDKRYAVAGRYWMWLLIMVALWFPFATLIPRPALQIDVPVSSALDMELSVTATPSYSTTEPPVDKVYPTYSFVEVIEEPARSPIASPAISVLELLLAMWLTGALISLIWHVSAHLSLVGLIKRWRTPVTDPDIIATFDEQRSLLGVGQSITLWQCKKINAPMLIGFIKPSLLLPDSLPKLQDMPLIFRHELTHYNRLDLWYKLALLVTKCVYWFNPAVHMMVTQANKDVETICDVITVNGLDMDMRRKYSEIILSMASKSFCPSNLTTNIGGGKNMLKQRFSNIFSNNKKTGGAVFVTLGAIIFAVGILVGFNFAPAERLVTEDTPEEEAYQFAFDSEYGFNYEDFGNAWGQNTDNWNYDVNNWQPNIEDWMQDVDNWSYGVGNWQQNIENWSYGVNNWQNQGGFPYDTSLENLKNKVYSDPRLIERQFGEYDDISSLNISTICDYVKVTQGGNKLVIKYYDKFENGYSSTFADGKLILSENNIPYLRANGSTSNQWYNDYMKEQGKSSSNPVEIIIPSTMSLDDIRIDTVSGSVNAKDCSATSLYADTTSGAVNIENCKAKTLIVDTTSGSVNLKDSSAVNMSVDTTSGSVNIENSAASNITSISTVSGRGHVGLSENAKNYNIIYDTVSGNLTHNGNSTKDLRNNGATRTITFQSVSGALSIDDVN